SDVYFLERMDTIGDEAKQLESITNENQVERLSRIDFWKASVQIFKDHPLGIGVRNFQNIVPYYDPRNPGRDAHNTYVLCYTEIGIIGIILFMVIIIEAFFQLRRIRRMIKGTPYEQEISLFAISLTTSLLIYLLGGMTSHSYLYNEITWMLFALPICLENATRKLVDTADVTSEKETN
ncbi:O-antigen ligase family protein, partial [bacterium]|nr:O-antigen ligase family protein [bacterium]